MDASLRAYVRGRAGDRCEYCRIPQSAFAAVTFHIDHIIARQHGGSSDESNLALACFHCNVHKGPNLSGVDPVTGAMVALFHPRRQEWSEHFEILKGVVINGKTVVGSATVSLLKMNAPDRQEIRRLLGM